MVVLRGGAPQGATAPRAVALPRLQFIGWTEANVERWIEAAERAGLVIERATWRPGLGEVVLRWVGPRDDLVRVIVRVWREYIAERDG